MQQFGLASTTPGTFTWSNSRGSTSKIDFILVSTPTINLVRDTVHEDTDFLLGCDHRAVSTAFYQPSIKSPKAPRTTRSHNRCGQWRIDGTKAIPACNALAEHLELSGRDFVTPDLEGLARQVSYRPKSHRYKDPQNIKDLIKQRRSLSGREARNLGKDNYARRLRLHGSRNCLIKVLRATLVLLHFSSVVRASLLLIITMSLGRAGLPRPHKT